MSNGANELQQFFFIFEYKPFDSPTTEDDDIDRRLLFFHPFVEGDQAKCRRLFLFGACEAFWNFAHGLRSTSQAGEGLHDPQDPLVMRLDALVIAMARFGSLCFVISGTQHQTDYIMKRRLTSLYRAMVFYNGPLGVCLDRIGSDVEARRTSLCRMATEVVLLLGDTVQHSNPLSSLDAIRYCNTSASTFILARQALEGIVAPKRHLSACVFYDRAVICSEIACPDLVTWIGNRIANRQNARSAGRSHGLADGIGCTGPDPSCGPCHADGAAAGASHPGTRSAPSAWHLTTEGLDRSPVWLGTGAYEQLLRRGPGPEAPPSPTPLSPCSDGPSVRSGYRLSPGPAALREDACADFSPGLPKEPSEGAPPPLWLARSPPRDAAEGVFGDAVRFPVAFPSTERFSCASSSDSAFSRSAASSVKSSQFGNEFPGRTRSNTPRSTASSDSAPSVGPRGPPTPSVELPEWLTEVTADGRYLGLLICSLSRISVAVLMPVQMLYDERHIAGVSHALQGCRLKELEQRVACTAAAAPEPPGHSEKGRTAADRWGLLDGGDPEDAGSGGPGCPLEWDPQVQPCGDVGVLHFDRLERRVRAPSAQLPARFSELVLFAHSLFEEHGDVGRLVSVGGGRNAAAGDRGGGVAFRARRVRTSTWCYARFHATHDGLCGGLEGIELQQRVLGEEAGWLLL